MWIKLLKEYEKKSIGEVIQVDDGAGGVLVTTGYAEKHADPIGGVADQLMAKAAEQMSVAFNKALTESLRQFSEVTKKTGAEKIEKPETEKKNFGRWLQCVAAKDHETMKKEFGEVSYVDWRSEVMGKAALNSQTGAQGGYVIPTVFYPQLMRIAAEMSIVRRKATIIPMGSRSVLIPTLDITTAPAAGDTAFFGGLVARWTEEAATLNETEPTFKQLELVAHELSGYSLASMALLQDNAVALEALLMQIFGAAIAWYEDYAFLRGNGVGKPLGVTAAGAAVQVTRATANQFKLQDAAKMLAKLLPGWQPNTTCWVVSPSVLEYLIQMSDSAGQAIWIPNAREGLPMTLFGIPVMVTEKLPALGTADDVLLCDFKHYLIGDRMQLEIAASEHFKFTNNQITWRFVHRVDGQPWLRSAVTLSDATSTVSPFIRLN